MADVDDGIIPSTAAWDRASKAIRFYEGFARDLTGRAGTNHPAIGETIFAKLGTRKTAGFEWTENQRFQGSNDTESRWQTLANGRSGSDSADPKFLAVEIVKGTFSQGQDVFMRWTPTEVAGPGPSDPPTTRLEWVIVAPIVATQFQCTNSNGNGSTCKAKVYSGVSGQVGDEVEVQVQHITNVGDKFYAMYAGKNGYNLETYVQLGLPPAKSRGMCLQIMDGQNNLGTVDWDFPKGHNQ